MLDLLKEYKGNIIVNGIFYNNVSEAIEKLKNFNGEIEVKLNLPKEEPQNKISNLYLDNNIYRIKVRQYMTKPSCPEFNFHENWNNNIPMPMRIMIGKKIQETKGMIKMELWGDIIEEQTDYCMKCGKILTNPVSKYFGIGPECGGHNYVNPFDSPAELKAAIKAYKEKLNKTTWTGWIIKSAIEEEEILKEGY
jgi:hypothetical protein